MTVSATHRDLLAEEAPGDVRQPRAEDRDDIGPLLRWMADQPEPPSIELVCAHHPKPHRGRPVTAVVVLPGCAAALSVASYLEAMSGAAAVHVATDRCPRATEVTATVQVAADLLQACRGTAGSAELTCSERTEGRHRRAVYPLHRLPLPRRRMLTLGLVGAPAVPERPTDDRSRTLAALQRLAADSHGDSAAGLAAMPAPAAALVASSCTACGVCVRACAPGALRLDTTDSTFALFFDPATCTDCGRCTQLCPDQSLTRTGPVDWARVVHGSISMLASGRTQSCPRCGGSFSADRAMTACPVCTYRRAHPFGSHVMRPSTPRP
jgi:formate hydrogenlyase subunit 6/NADH:ubiquinone oxidoreductase subunit I